MTIDEAIEFEKAEIKGERQLYNNGGFAEYHEQLVEWLEELKDYRDKNKMVVRIDALNLPTVIENIKKTYLQGNYDAFDECFRKFCEYDLEHYGEWLKEQCDEAEEQLKEKKND